METGKKGRFPHFLILSFCFFVSSAQAHYIGGYYECYYEAERDGEFRFNISQPKHYLQLKLWSDPLPYSGIYSQFSASTWEDDARVKFDRGYAEKTFYKKSKLMLLYKEERHWVSSPLLYLVDTGKAQRGAKGARFEAWDIGHFRSELIATLDNAEYDDEWYGNYFDTDGNTVIGRLDYSSRVVKIGTNFIKRQKQYKKYSLTSSSASLLSDKTYDNTVNSADVRFDLRFFSLVAEGARTDSDWHETSSGNTAWQTEVRDFFFGPLNLSFSYYDYGRNFHAVTSKKFSGYDGNSEFDRKGFKGECLFLVPQKAVNLTYKYSFYETGVESVSNNSSLREDYTVNYSSARADNFWSFSEVYIRMMQGINFRAGIETNSGLSDRKNFLMQIDGETPLHYSGLVVKIVDVGKSSYPGQKLILAVIQKINITDHLQMFARFCRGSAETMTWHSGFFQLKYFIGYDFEMYLECGDSWPTEALYSETRFADNTDLSFAKTVKFTMKMNF